MSLFQTTEQNQSENPNQPANQEDWLKKLVETKGEQWRDPQVVAKGKLEADAYVKQLESQLAEIREEMGKQDYSKELLEALKNKAPESTNGQSPQSNNDKGGTTQSQTNSALSDEQIKRLVETALTEREKTNTSTQNITLVEQKMSEAFGTEAQAKVQEKAKELGLSLQRMQEIAAESPTAFLNLIGDKAKELQPIVKGTIRTEGVNMQASSERNFGFYQELRRKNRKQYFSPEVQRQMFQDRTRLGEKFYQ